MLFEVIKDIHEIKKDDIEVVVPKNREHGDFSSNIAMKLAKELNMKPYEIGNLIKEKIQKKYNIFENIKLEGPGFINFYIKEFYFTDKILKSVEKGDFKRFSIKNENVKLALILSDINEILELSEFRAFMNMYYLGNIYNLAGYKVSKTIVVYNDEINNLDNFLSNFKGVKVTKNFDELNDSIIFSSYKNQFLLKQYGIKDKRYIVNKVNVYKNKIERNDIDTVQLIDILGFDRLKYSLCTNTFTSEVYIEITRDDLRFITYPYSRISSVINILEKEGILLGNIEDVKEIILENNLEKEILTKLTQFKDIVKSSIAYNDFFKIIKYANDLCENFYKLNSITLYRKLGRQKLMSRLRLLNSVKIILEEIYKLLEVSKNYCL
ncbi:DALR anticodon-binding domain-containing protein [Caminicella sporogenes]|uniref:DALR anticodon-binding domain-containing protein n=1 Tax=Caminicella sporogenes TaxID=166485 RepID=UPI00253FAA59|nr:DALR anticodon-binding domain-containing protein [Caminicella sporogenes]WIF96163.1 DALR anticodon-binding domain-containing protein [Caminicella sporogenes]